MKAKPVRRSNVQSQVCVGHYTPKYNLIEKRLLSAKIRPDNTSQSKKKCIQIKKENFNNRPICAKLIKTHDEY